MFYASLTNLKFISDLHWAFRGLISSVSKEESNLGRLILSIVVASGACALGVRVAFHLIIPLQLVRSFGITVCSLTEKSLIQMGGFFLSVMSR